MNDSPERAEIRRGMAIRIMETNVIHSNLIVGKSGQKIKNKMALWNKYL